jgi:hypothetical protein
MASTWEICFAPKILFGSYFWSKKASAPKVVSHSPFWDKAFFFLEKI